MAQYSFIKVNGNILNPATPDAAVFLSTQLNIGDILSCEFKKVRNPIFHRKYFSLLNLGFDYWEPSGGAISPVER